MFGSDLITSLYMLVFLQNLWICAGVCVHPCPLVCPPWLCADGSVILARQVWKFCSIVGVFAIRYYLPMKQIWLGMHHGCFCVIRDYLLYHENSCHMQVFSVSMLPCFIFLVQMLNNRLCAAVKMPRYDDRCGGKTWLYVGRVSSRTRTQDLEDLFGRYGRLSWL